MNLIAYLDESGTHGGSRAIAVAGFLARADQWGAFKFQWSRQIESWGLDAFHMASFESRRPGYDWPDEERRSRINTLLAIIRQYLHSSVATTFAVADYDAAFPPGEIPLPLRANELSPGILGPWAHRPGDPELADVQYRPGELRRKTGGPYGLAAATLMPEVAAIARTFPDDPSVDLVFEDGAEGRGQLLKVVQGMIADDSTRREYRLNSIAFGQKQDPGLQAADLLAYEICKHLPRELGVETRPTRYTLPRIHRSTYRARR